MFVSNVCCSSFMGQKKSYEVKRGPGVTMIIVVTTLSQSSRTGSNGCNSCQDATGNLFIWKKMSSKESLFTKQHLLLKERGREERGDIWKDDH